jgi:hypothetical protein
MVCQIHRAGVYGRATTKSRYTHLIFKIIDSLSISSCESLHQVIAAVDALVLLFLLRRICPGQSLDVTLEVGVAKVAKIALE